MISTRHSFSVATSLLISNNLGVGMRGGLTSDLDLISQTLNQCRKAGTLVKDKRKLCKGSLLTSPKRHVVLVARYSLFVVVLCCLYIV